MGRTGFTMTLLSTLAALVIIVHTAEEEYERAQRGIRARSLDVGTPGYEQTWRAMEVDPQLSEIPQDDARRNDAPDDMPIRRRNMRKRKRRPQMEPSSDLLPQEMHVFPGKGQPQNPEYFITPPDTIRRRRKQNRKNAREQRISERWGDQTDIERPVRRRGHRRKRPPTVEPWPRLSEFDDYRPNEAIADDSEWDTKQQEPIDNDESINTNDQENIDDMGEKHEDSQRFSLTMYKDETHDPTVPEVNTQNDRSLSEFSLESLIKQTDDGLKFAEEKPKHIPSERNKAIMKAVKDSEPLEPLTLKAILKRSNGRSLSEILQQNNLSLSDLLQGRENALALLKADESTENHETINQIGNFESENIEKSILLNSESKQIDNHKQTNEPESTTEYTNTTENDVADTQSKSTIAQQNDFNSNNTVEENDVADTQSKSTIAQQNDFNSNNTVEENDVADTQSKSTIAQQNDFNSNNTVEEKTKNYVRRRFPFNLRRKLRTRPVNSTYKGQLSRDLMTLTTRKYQNNRNIVKSKEWIEYMPSNTKAGKTKSEVDNDQDDHVTENSISITTILLEETTPASPDHNYSSTSSRVLDANSSKSINAVEETTNDNTLETEEFSTTFDDVSVPNPYPVTEKVVTITQKPKIISHLRSILNTSDLRRQAIDNRLKKKRIRQNNLSNESDNDLQKVISRISNILPASEFTAKTQPSTLNTDDENDFTTLEDFMTTESVIKPRSRMRSTTAPNIRSSILPKIQPYLTATEETAKIEIEEILNDSRIRARLSRILMERNMTLNELVEHRERGSSHVHLADIFHNASREPNPAEPFLSKSLIEPISKETYPLRALLDANLHDPKTNLDENSLNSNIPVIMDFGNNVNENGENMGIMSLFDNNNTSKIESRDKQENLQELMPTNDEDKKDEQKSIRESRVLSSENGLVNWNELFKLLHNQTDQEEFLHPRVSSKSETLQKILLEEDHDADGILVFEDLQQLKDNNVASSTEDNFELKLQQRTEDRPTQQVYNLTSNTRSVTVVTASIIGLGLVLFLLTYAAFKWKQQSKIIENKQCNIDDRLPSPIFESRKGNIRSSTRSKSPMLTSNIYSVNTLDTHAGSDSPEYMWDSLRKPFQ